MFCVVYYESLKRKLKTKTIYGNIYPYIVSIYGFCNYFRKSFIKYSNEPYRKDVLCLLLRGKGRGKEKSNGRIFLTTDNFTTAIPFTFPLASWTTPQQQHTSPRIQMPIKFFGQGTDGGWWRTRIVRGTYPFSHCRSCSINLDLAWRLVTVCTKGRRRMGRYTSCFSRALQSFRVQPAHVGWGTPQGSCK